jgi:hypothetical protein
LAFVEVQDADAIDMPCDFVALTFARTLRTCNENVRREYSFQITSFAEYAYDLNLLQLLPLNLPSVMVSDLTVAPGTFDLSIREWFRPARIAVDTNIDFGLTKIILHRPFIIQFWLSFN